MNLILAVLTNFKHLWSLLFWQMSDIVTEQWNQIKQLEQAVYIAEVLLIPLYFIGNQLVVVLRRLKMIFNLQVKMAIAAKEMWRRCPYLTVLYLSFIICPLATSYIHANKI